MSQSEEQPSEIKIPVPWGHIAAKVYGPPKEDKILVVHGIMDNAGSFDRLLSLLPQRYQYVSIDLPGHGLSSPFPPGVPLHFFDYVHAVLLVLDALKWKTCIYLAHSFGTHIATFFSILYPGRLEKIIAIDGILPFIVEDLISHTRKIYDLQSYSKDMQRLYTKDEIIFALKYRRAEALNTAAAEAIFKRGVTEVNGLYKYNRDARLREFVIPIFTVDQHKAFLTKFTTPTLVILATDSRKADIILPLVNLVRSQCKGVKNLTVVTAKGNHDVHNNYPERVAPHIYKFLNKDLESKL